MRKILLTAFIICLATFAGCAKDKQGKQQGEVTGDASAGKTEKQFVSEDYDPGNRTKYLAYMMKTDKGFYHYDKGLRYYDNATKRTMFLCNKPECRHDGNEFCVATNGKYLHLNRCLYNDVILEYVVEESDTQYHFKLLSVALDGSEMNEIASTFTFEKPVEGFAVYQCFMYVHRNKAFLTMAGSGQAEQEEYYGAAILDLNTKEVNYLDEEPFGKNNEEVTKVTAQGDYFYYCRKEGKKLLLHRYNIVDETDESFRLLPTFEGDYVVVDEDTIAYLKSAGNWVCTYRISTGQNKEQTRMMRQYYEYQMDGSYRKSEKMKESMVTQLATDGTYIYAAEPIREYADTEGTVVKREAYIHVLNQNLEEVLLADMAEAATKLGYDDMEWERSSYTQKLRYMGDDIYWCLESKETPDSKDTSDLDWYAFRCKRSDFIAGNPKFEFVYRYEDY